MQNRDVPKGKILEHEQVRRLAITAVFSDDYFFERVVLKGGNALAIALGLSSRTSLDLDFSIENDFENSEEAALRLKAALQRRFAGVGMVVFDFTFAPRPITPREGASKWGGYVAEFKLLDEARYKEIGDNRDAHRRESMVIGPSQQRKFSIELSKFEFTQGNIVREIDSFDVRVYTPEMIALEKLRAICQQMRDYALNRTPSARARDFFDIHLIHSITGFRIGTPENAEQLRHIFAAKDVPLKLLQLIAAQREFHRPDWDSVRQSINNENLKEFDFYFDFVVEEVNSLGVIEDL
jgi:Nucleotidyl transferase AbiEii toxin, Type IV TA system